MATKNQGIKTVKSYLKENNYSDIYKNYPTLTILEAKRILETLLLNNINNEEQADNEYLNDIILLIKEKVIPTIQYSRVNIGKQKVRQLKNNQSAQIADGNNVMDLVTPQVKQIGSAYKLLGDCYNGISDITSAINYYTKAERCGVDCSQELNILSNNYPTPNLNKIIQKAKMIRGQTFQEISKRITDYAYKIIDDVLQLSIVSLSDDIHDNLRTAFATYLRNEVAGLKENPPMINLASSFEKILKEFFYIPYAKYLDDNENKANILKTCERLRKQKIAKGNISFLKFSNSFTLGNLKPLIVEGFNEDGTYQIDETFYNFITNYYHIKAKEFSQEDFASLIRFVEVFRDTIRNPVGHGVGMHSQTFGYICEELLLKENSWVKQLVKITNNEYLQTEDLINKNSPTLISQIIDKNAFLPNSSNTQSFVAYVSTSESFDVNKFINELQLFIEKNGRYPNVHSGKHAEFKLARTVNFIRLIPKGINKFDLTEMDIEKLNNFGFQWTAKIDWFNDFYTSLLQYKNQYGSLHISPYYVDEGGKHLGKEVLNVRKSYIGDGTLKLTNEQINLLNNIGFEFNINGESVKWFEELYQDLVEYKNIFGNFDGVVEDKVVGPKILRFIKDYQREKIGKVSSRRITKTMLFRLRDIGLMLDYNCEQFNNENEFQR